MMKIPGPKLEIEAREAGIKRAFATIPMLDATVDAVVTADMLEFERHFLSSERV